MSPFPACDRCGAPLSLRASSVGDCPRCLVARALAPPPAPDAIPVNFGDYEIGEEVGRGGMGVVRRARQCALDREVALKLLPFELLESEDFLERFEREARLMARLTHPGIARVFEAGISPAGQPYLSMELVAGEPVTTFLRTRPSSLHARLGVFLQMCDAVQHAHARGIIHRDLKPSNVLAAAGEDGSVVVKVIDFGLARPAEDPAPDAALWRSQAAVVGTPLYMSPEQAAGGEVDIRADVYSLGVLLCEMIAGAPPFADAAFAGRKREEVAEALRKTPAQPPSEVRASLDPTDEASLPSARALRGDLDAICAHALAKEPADRYPTVAALAEDVRRHLAHEPVRARLPTTGYVLGRYVRRHRVLLGVTALVVLGLAGAALFSAGQARSARLARDRAERVKTLLVEVLGAPAPGADGRAVRVVDVLARVGERAQEELRDDPATLAELRLALGTTYYNLSLHDEAEPLLRAALADSRRLSGNASLAAANALKALGDQCNWTSRQTEAGSLLREAAAIYRRHLPESAAVLARTLQSIASVEIHGARHGAAVPLLEESIRWATQSGGPEGTDTLVAKGDLAMCLDALARGAEARRLFEEVIGTMRARPDLRENLATLLGAQASFLADAGDLPGAERALEESLARRRELFGPESLPVAASLGRLAWVRLQRGDLARAEEEARAGLALHRRLLPAGSRDSHSTLRSLAFVLLRTGRAAEARPLLAELADVVRRHMNANAALLRQVEEAQAEAAR